MITSEQNQSKTNPEWPFVGVTVATGALVREVFSVLVAADVVRALSPDVTLLLALADFDVVSFFHLRMLACSLCKIHTAAL